MTLHHGDCIEVMRGMDAESVSAIVCDPPYGLGFMGKDWDSPGGTGDFPMRRSDPINTVNTGAARQGGRQRSCEDFTRRQARDLRAFQEWCQAWSSEALRLLKPGGHLVAFGGTRTYHRLACGVEDAGFEIRDSLAWLFGQGFPKSLDVSKQLDKMAGADREVVGYSRGVSVEDNQGFGGIARGGVGIQQTAADIPVTAPATEDAKRAHGWGTALKPAHEQIVLARKSLNGTVAATFAEHGTGALNIDASRIGFASEDDQAAAAARRALGDQNSGRTAYGRFENGPASLGPYLANMDKGRWPANVVLDEEAAAQLDEQTRGTRADRPSCTGSGFAATGAFPIQNDEPLAYTDVGGASRFFYCAKASRAERNAGLEALPLAPVRNAHTHSDGRGETRMGRNAEEGIRAITVARNVHPTVKPINLMRWLVRLVTPSAGVILDPFLGSGTTAVAATLEGFQWLGIEQDADYLAIAEARVAFWREHGEDGLRIVADREASERIRAEVAAAGQLDLLGEDVA